MTISETVNLMAQLREPQLTIQKQQKPNNSFVLRLNENYHN